MAIGKNKKQKPQSDVVSVPQTGKTAHPFLTLSSYSPYSTADYSLFRSLREAVPIIDAAIMKTVRLLGTFQVKCDNEDAELQLKSFLSRVNVGGTRNGIDAFVSTFFEQLLTYGTAVGEMITNGYTITHLFNSDLKDISLTEGSSPVDIIVSSDSGNDGNVPSQNTAENNA